MAGGRPDSHAERHHIVSYYVFAYPLKFLALLLVNLFTGFYETCAQINTVLPLDQVQWFIVIYAAGYTAVFGVFALLYAHALKRADDLELCRAERILTQLEVHQGIAAIVISVLAGLTALLRPDRFSPIGGCIYFLIGADVVQASAGGSVA